MTELQIDALLEKLDRIATVMETIIANNSYPDPIQLYVSQKANEKALIETYGNTIVDTWKAEAEAIKTAKP